MNNKLYKNQNQSEDYVMITGASSGIGRAFAYRAAKAHRNLLLVAIENTGLEKLASELENQYNIHTAFFEIDLTEPSAYYDIFEFCKNKGITINILINNVGFGYEGRFDMLNSKVINYMIQLNVTTMVNMSHMFLDQLGSNNKDSFILNVSSMAALIPVPYKSLYSASKKFIYTFSNTLAVELKSRNVFISCLCPGPVITNSRILKDIKSKGWLAKVIVKSADEVADFAWKNMLRKKTIIIPGWENRLLRFVVFFIPAFIRNWFFNKVYKKYKFLPYTDLDDKLNQKTYNDILLK